MSRRERLKGLLFGKKPRKDGSQSIASPSSQSVDRDQPLDTPSSRQRAREAAIILLDFGIIISEATDLLKPMKAVCGFIKKVIEVAKNVEHVDNDWKGLINRLKFHIATMESQTGSLEEDQRLGEVPPPVNSKIEEPLKVYISTLNAVCEQLNTVYQGWHDDAPSGLSRIERTVDVDHNKGVIVDKTRELDDAFQRYTVALEHFIAGKVDQIQRELGQFRLEVKQQIKVEHLDRVKASNQYGKQHRRCLEGTRVKTLSAVHEWANENTTNRIFCLLDAAGSGKSTVAKSLIEDWNREGWLIGRFFFSRDTAETMSTRLFCSTVSNAFASLDANFKVHVAGFKTKPDLELLPFDEQFEGLVTNPLTALGRRAILVIDALDECDNTSNDLEVLLKTLLDKQSSIPLLQTFITGRPHIKRWLMKADGIIIKNFHDLEGINRDVEFYIRYQLQDMPDIQDRVMRRAEGLFIWARIACDLLLDGADIDGLLEELEGGLEGDAKLDSIYRVALEQATPEDRPSQRAMLKVLEMILAARKPLSIAELEMLSPSSGRNVVERIVSRLGSLLLYHAREDPIRLLHTTIREFLTTQKRAGSYYIQPELGHYTLALGSLNTLKHQVSSDIGNQDEISRREVDSFDEMMLTDFVLRTFDYASDSWVHHCTMSYMKLALNKEILKFAESGLQPWISVMGQDRAQFTERIGNILLLSCGNMRPQVAKIVVDLSLEEIVCILVAYPDST